MDDVKNISIREIVQSDMVAVIELLQSMSEFKPSKSEYLLIWNSFHQQSNVHSLVAVIDNQIVGYGSIIIETKIRGGKMGHIEDIVSHSLRAIFQLPPPYVYHSWCQPCKRIQPFFDQCSSQYAKDESIGAFFTIDVDDFDEIASKYKVAMMPTFLVVQGDQVLGTYAGSSEPQLEQFLKEQLGAAK